MNPLSYFGQTSNDMYAADMSAMTGSAVAVGIILFVLFFVILAYVVQAYLLSRIFNKASIPGWKAWVPVYSTWMTLEMGDKDGRWSLLFLTPLVVSFMPISDPSINLVLSLAAFAASIVSTIFLYIAMYRIGVGFKKEEYFVLWAIFLPVVWYAWLAFDSSTWHKTPTASPHNQPTSEPNV